MGHFWEELHKKPKRILLILFCFGLLTLNNFLLLSQYHFRSYSINDGLSSNSVLAIEMDSRGYLWVGTYYGLNRFDGQNFKQYFLEGHTIESKDQISDIFTDSMGRLWVGTFGNIYMYDEEQDEFIRINQYPVNVGEIAESPDRTIWVVGYGAYIIDESDLSLKKVKVIGGNERKIEDIEFDSMGRIWLGWFDAGITMCKFVRIRDEEELYIERFFISDNSVQLRSNIVRDLFIDQSDRLWLTSYEGLYWIDLTQADEDLTVEKLPGQSSKSRFWSITQDQQGLIWAGSYGDGLYIVDPTGVNEVVNIKTNLQNPRSISCNEIHAIKEDTYGNIWIATENGLNKVVRRDINYITYYYTPDNPNSLSSNHVCQIYQDQAGILWMGTSKGLSMFDYNRNDGIFERFYLSDSGYMENFILSLLPTGKGDQFYIGCRDGLYTYEPGKKARKIEIIRHRYNKSILTVRYIVEIGSRLWLATDNGVHIYDHLSDELVGFMDFNHQDLDCHNILYDDDHTVWLATNYGVKRIMNPSSDVSSFEVQVYSLDTLRADSDMKNVTYIIQDDQRMIWIGTYDGLYRLNPASGEYRLFNSQIGLREDFVAGLIEYQGNIMVLGLSSISSINKKDFVIESYSFNTAITNERESFYLTLLNDGNLALGGINGLKILDPDELNTGTLQYPLVIQDLRIGTRSIKPAVDRKSEKVQSISSTDRIFLEYHANTFSLEFASLYFSDPVQFMYAYRLDGYDEDWIYVNHNQGYANYSKLSPGNYVFRVNATNSTGQWNHEDTLLKITVLPPFWLKWYAILFYITCLVILLIFVRHEVSIRYKLATEKLAKSEIEKKNEEQMQFFINISHELRTPLAMINGPLEHIHQVIEKNDELYKYSEWALNNACKLTEITNEILDLRLLNANKMQPTRMATNWKDFIETIYNYFKNLALRKKIHYTLENHIDQVVIFDIPMIEKSVVNLLDNAFKYAPEQAEVSLKAFVEKGKLSGKEDIHVVCSNTGSTIAKEDLDKIFERFYRAGKYESGGSGIGLSITKQFIELHKGKIWCESDDSSGVAFHVLIPLETGIRKKSVISASTNESIYNRIYGMGEDNRPETSTVFGQGGLASDSEGVSKSILTSSYWADHPAEVDRKGNGHNNGYSKPLLLLVEDDLNLRDFLASILDERYQVICATDGREAFEIVTKKVHPDLIISDIMMPVMDGFTLCDRIKGDDITSHIPIILLTARPEKYSLLDSYKHEANAYIEKPFSKELLTFCIKSILHQHEIMRKYYGSTLVDFHRKEDDSDPNRKFLESVKQVILDHIDNSELSIEILCREMSISQYMLYNKVRAITGKTPGQIIKTIRIYKAEHLLRKNIYSIKEIQYLTGFNSAKSLRDAFKQEFGVLPSQYKDQIEI